MNYSRTIFAAVVGVGVVVAAPTAGTAQETVTVPDAPACSRCRIELTPLRRLGPAGDIPTSPEGVTQDSRGRYWLAFTNELAMVYEADGTHLTTVKRGEGPGEFQYPWMITAVGDSLFVQDRGRGFLVVGPDLKIVRSVPGPPNMGRVVVLDWPDSVLINTRRYDARTDMNPYHVVSFAEREPVYVRSFGAERAAPTDAREFVSFSRVIAPARNDGIWVAQQRTYQLHELSMSGEVRRALVREPSWFPKEVPPMNFKEPPPPHIAAVHEDSAGLLWVYIRVAAPTWRGGYPKVGEGVGEVSASAFAMDLLYDGIIEVIDPRQARVLARTKVDGHVIGQVSGGQVAIYDTTADGEPFVQIMRVSLDR